MKTVTFDRNDNNIASVVDRSFNPQCNLITDPTTTVITLDVNKYTKNSLCILCHNIRSIYKNFDSFVLFSSFIDINVDIYVLTECWTNENQTIPLIKNYNMHYTKKSYNKADGIVIYIKNNINASISEPDFNNGNCSVINIEDKITIICSYRPPCFPDPNVYLESLDQLLGKINTKTVILTGDININTANLKSDITQHYLNITATYGLIQGIDKPTRYPSQTTLDHFMVKCSSPWKTVIYEQANITDHSPILLYICNENNIKTQQVQRYRKLDCEAITAQLKLFNWEHLYEICNVDLATNYFINSLNNIIETNSILCTVSRKFKSLKPWITVGIIKCLRKRDNTHKSVKCNNGGNLKNTT